MSKAKKISLLTITIHGNRGSGKSTIMDLLKKQLDQKEVYYEVGEPSHMSDKNPAETLRVYLVHEEFPKAAVPRESI